MRRRSLGSILISSLDPKIKERILNHIVDSDVIKKFQEEERKENVAALVDLRDLLTKSETEVYDVLNVLCQNKQYFIYCGPLLININPGPTNINNYLNLQSWLKETSKIAESKWKPHLYSYVHYVYQNLVNDNKDQVINMLGQTGSGKTFNIVHILEYFTHIAGPEGLQTELFDTVHKSMQLVHILGSFFRQNNMESSSNGMLLKLTFDDNNKICSFDLDSKILDFTLPFSENGRSFSILHALMTGANSEIKKMLELPEVEIHLNFFRKFHSSYDDRTKEKFKLNDYEIWTKFHSLLNFFKFSKTETVELLQLMSFILLVNEASIGKKKIGKLANYEEYIINKGLSSKRLAKNLNMSEEDFLRKMGSFKELADIKNFLISLMKYSYYMIFDYVKNKVRNYLRDYFEKMNGGNAYGTNFGNFGNNTLNHSFSGLKTKNLYIIDFPGEVDDQTLGGLSTNLANECLNVYAATNFLTVVDKLEQEKLYIKYFQPLHCYHVTESLIGNNGLFSFLSKPFTEENYKKLRAKIRKNKNFQKTIEFTDSTNPNGKEFQFFFKFSHKVTPYNYESLYQESKSLTVTQKIHRIFEGSKNSIVRAVFKHVLGPVVESKDPSGTQDKSNKNFFSYTVNMLKDFFRPLEGLSPFVIYCLHSNNSHKIFFGEKNKNHSKDWFIPHDMTLGMLKNSLAIPVLYWEWFGYHEWVEIHQFLNEFLTDFKIIKEKILKSKEKENKEKQKKIKEISFEHMNPYESVTYILSILGNEKQYFLGVKHVILRKGSLRELRKMIDHMKNFVSPNDPKKASDQRRTSKINIGSNNSFKSKNRSNSITSDHPIIDSSNSKKNSIQISNKQRSGSIINEQGASRKRFNEGRLSVIKIGDENSIPGIVAAGEKKEQRRRSMTIQCHLNIIDNLKSHFNPVGNQGYNSGYNSQKNKHSSSKEKKSNLNLSQLANNSEMFNISQSSQGNSSQIIHNSNYSLFKFFQGSLSANNSLNTSLNISQEIEDESNYEKFKKENNIVLPKKQYFNAFKSLFDYSKLESFDIFDYSDNVKEAVRIQTAWRGCRARRKYVIYRYILKKVTQMQKNARAMIIRKKFKKFLYAHTCIVFIQKLYRMRHDAKMNAATKIQSIYRKNKAYNKFLDKLAVDENDDYDMELDEEFYKMDKKKNDMMTELMNVSVKTVKKVNITTTNNNNASHMSYQMTIQELEMETDKNKIIEHLLMDPNLDKGKIMNIRLNKSKHAGMSVNLKNQISEQQKIHKKNKIMQNKSGPKIEDKLIQEGEKRKMKLATQRLEKVKVINIYLLYRMKKATLSNPK